jgi:ectoine hydroxylase-related dioxygenase (phytanoyl-CoA dioxygenase family)
MTVKAQAMDPYPDFLDSTNRLADSHTLRTRLDRDGYLFIRNLLPAQTILAVRERLLAKAATGGWLHPDSPVQAGIANPAAACKDPEDRYMRVFRGLWMDEELHRLRIHPVVTDLFTRIFGEPALAHPMFVQRNIFPQAGSFDFTTGMHQDRVHIGGATSYALWMPLGDCPREKGALAVAAGSHTKGILETRVGSGAGGMDIAVPIPGTWVTGAFRAGDALIFQDVTVHKALRNRTREIRMSFDARFQPVSQPVADTNMVPYAGCGTWEDVYAGWKRTDGQYFWKDLTLDIVPLDRSHYERRDAQALEMAERGDRQARDAILRIIQRDQSQEKRARAEKLLERLDAV